MTETINETVLNDLIGKVIGDVAGAMSLYMAYLGIRQECSARSMVPVG